MVAVRRGLLLLSSVVASFDATAADAGDDAPQPPIWQDRWHAEFTVEKWGNTWLSQTKNGGGYHYDVSGLNEGKGFSVEHHGKGQRDNWCGCASGGKDDCKIHAFLKDPLDPECKRFCAASYVVISTEEEGPSVCCKLFKGPGGGPLAPGWQSADTFLGDKSVRRKKTGGKLGSGRRVCQEWINDNPGNAALMVGDLWMTSYDNVPCGYKDKFKWWARWVLGYYHYFWFDMSTYSTEPEEDDVFALPEGIDCNQPCPNRESKFKPWCDVTWDGGKPEQQEEELRPSPRIPIRTVGLDPI